jgi:hypothetical protein
MEYVEFGGGSDRWGDMLEDLSEDMVEGDSIVVGVV